MSERLETMAPNPAWSADAHDDVVATLADLPDDAVVKVWGGDWCKDCRAQLPDLAAAFEAAGIGPDRIEHHPVEHGDDGKVGPLVEEYDIERIPTVVIERDGTELARFVERADVPAATYLADRLRAEH